MLRDADNDLFDSIAEIFSGQIRFYTKKLTYKKWLHDINVYHELFGLSGYQYPNPDQSPPEKTLDTDSDRSLSNAFKNAVKYKNLYLIQSSNEHLI